jgi:hypothetical protein
MRRFALAGTGVLLVLGLAAGPAFGHGPSGSHEEDGSPAAWDNQVTCGAGTSTPVGVVYAGQNGAEVCNDGRGAVPVQGRIIVTSDQGGYVAADGDADNAPEAQGWIRVDGNGVRCGDEAGRRDATHPTSADTMEDCG